MEAGHRGLGGRSRLCERPGLGRRDGWFGGARKRGSLPEPVPSEGLGAKDAAAGAHLPPAGPC